MRTTILWLAALVGVVAGATAYVRASNERAADQEIAAVTVSRGAGVNAAATSPTSNVTKVEDHQVVEIVAKGLYTPRISVALAGVPTVINVLTKNTVDCTISFSIPKLRYRTTMPSSGITAVEVPPQKAGTTLEGVCSMGMYDFRVRFI